MAKYADDPRWITTRYAGNCSGCSNPVPRNSRAYYYPKGRKILCSGCGDEAAARFAAQSWDEENNTCL